MIAFEVACPSFKPSSKDLKRSFPSFVESVESNCVPFGVCKITPPSTWFSSSQQAKLEDLERKMTPSHQTFILDSGASGTYKAEIAIGRSTTVQNFSMERKGIPAKLEKLKSLSDFEEGYWKSIAGGTVEYGSDIPGTLFDSKVQNWNVATLDSCLSQGLSSEGGKTQVPGVNTPYLYYGKWRSTFAWHTEDMDLHSVNYLHYGAPKVWYCVAPADKQKLETLFRAKLGPKDSECPEFMRHKKFHMKPSVLEKEGIKVHKVVQNPGDFIVTFPGAYHAGFNCGFNCAESTNFATPAWIKHGACAKICKCEKDSVRIDMSLFLGLAPDEATRTLIRARMTELHQHSHSDTQSESNSGLATAGSSGSVQASTSTQHSKAAHGKKSATANKAAQYSKAKSKLSHEPVPKKELTRKEQVQSLKAAKRAQHASAHQLRKPKQKATQKKAAADVPAAESPMHSTVSAFAPNTALPSPLQHPRRLTRSPKQASVPVPKAQHGTKEPTAQPAAQQTTAQPQATPEQTQPKLRKVVTAVLRQTTAGLADGLAMLLRSRSVSRPSSAEQLVASEQKARLEQQAGAGQLQEPGHLGNAPVAQADGYSPNQQAAAVPQLDDKSPKASSNGMQTGADANMLGSNLVKEADAPETKRRSKRKAKQRDDPALTGETSSDEFHWQGRRKVRRFAQPKADCDRCPHSFRALLQAVANDALRQ